MKVRTHDTVSEHMNREREHGKNVGMMIFFLMLAAILFYYGLKTDVYFSKYLIYAGAFIVLMMILWYVVTKKDQKKYSKRYRYH